MMKEIASLIALVVFLSSPETGIISGSFIQILCLSIGRIQA
jgi:hypothetical protein